MNQMKSQGGKQLPMFPVILFALLLVAAAGVLQAYYKNREIQTQRSIELVERRIDQHRLDIRTAQMRADQLLNRYVIRERLQQVGSDLKSIPQSAVEEVLPRTNNRNREVASLVP